MLDDFTVRLLGYCWDGAMEWIGAHCPGRQCQECKRRGCVQHEWLDTTREAYKQRLAELEGRA